MEKSKEYEEAGKTQLRVGEKPVCLDGMLTLNRMQRSKWFFVVFFNLERVQQTGHVRPTGGGGCETNTDHCYPKH